LPHSVNGVELFWSLISKSGHSKTALLKRTTNTLAFCQSISDQGRKFYKFASCVTVKKLFVFETLAHDKQAICLQGQSPTFPLLTYR